MRGARPLRPGRRREVLQPGRDLARLLDPVLAECRLHAADDGPLDAPAGVAPVVFSLAFPGPFLGDAEAADVADAAVDDHLLAVIAVVEAPDVAEAEGMKRAHLYAGGEHLVAYLVVHLVAAGGVDEGAPLPALPHLRRQRRRDLFADRAFPPDVRLDVHALARRGDVAQEQREKAVAVLEELDAVAGLEARLRQADDRRQESAEVAGVFHLQMHGAAALGGPEREREPGDDHEVGDEPDDRHAQEMRVADLLDAFYFSRCHISSVRTG